MSANDKRIMVDMSATLIHHGHIRLLKKAASYGRVIVALTTDDEIENKKGYVPELNFSQRKEILCALECVSEVVPCNWQIEHEFLIKHNIDLLVHGDDNQNDLPHEKLLIFPRTEGISSTDLRKRARDIVNLFNND
jgi:cytidyltransferase-like protein